MDVDFHESSMSNHIGLILLDSGDCKDLDTFHHESASTCLLNYFLQFTIIGTVLLLLLTEGHVLLAFLFICWNYVLLFHLDLFYFRSKEHVLLLLFKRACFTITPFGDCFTVGSVVNLLDAAVPSFTSLWIPFKLIDSHACLTSFGEISRHECRKLPSL